MFLAKKLNKGAGTPIAPVDAQFNYVTMLLHGDGTNGAQNNTFIDSSSNNFTITRNGNTTQGSFSPYGANWSNYFDGSGDYLSVPDNAALEGFTNFTFECWVNVSDFSSGDCIFAKGWTPGGFTPYMFYFTSTDLVFYASSSLSSWDVASGEVIVSNIVKNQWYHVAASRSGSSIKLFANGAVTTSFTGGSTLGTNAGALTIGASLSGDRDPTMYVSNLRINNTALYTAAFTPSTTPLTAVSGTALLTCADNRFIDDSTNNFTLTPNGNTSVQRFNPFGASTAYSTSVIGGSGYFNGSTNYLTVASNAALAFGTGDFTIECWAYANDVTSLAGIYDGRGPGATPTIVFQSGTIQYFTNGGFQITSSSVATGTWYHIAICRSGTSTKLFVNGVQGGSTYTDSTNYVSTTPSYIGSLYDGYYFNGFISDMRVVKGTALYTTTFTPPTAQLTAITNTSLLTKMINGAIFDNAMMNDLETVGNAQISTSVVKYGTGSLKFDGSGDYLASPNIPSLQLGSGDFTIEYWINYNSFSTYMTILDTGGYTGSSSVLFQTTITSGALVIYCAGVSITESSNPSLNTWYHYALVRSGSTATLYRNGTSVGSATSTSNITSANPFYVGGSVGGGGYYLDGYMDDVRVTKGYARYTANFTAPTAAFSDTGPN